MITRKRANAETQKREPKKKNLYKERNWNLRRPDASDEQKDITKSKIGDSQERAQRMKHKKKKNPQNAQ